VIHLLIEVQFIVSQVFGWGQRHRSCLLGGLHLSVILQILPSV
jgi:hypothetical protein